VTISFDPHFPIVALIAVGVAAAAFAAVGLWRHPPGSAFRALAVAALLGLLFNPLAREAERAKLQDIAIVLVDKSASQRIDGRDERAAAIQEALASDIEALGLELRMSDIEGEEETRAVAALKTALADAPRARLAGAFMITDGQVADADAAKTLALDAPVHMIITGDEAERDRKVTLLSAPRYGIVGQPVRVSFRIDDFGPDAEPVTGEGEAAMVTLRVNGKDVHRQAVPFGLEAGFDAPLARPGRTIIELEVEPREGELTTRNNIAVLPISAIRDRLRVLLISGEPHPGERVWRNLLKSDPAVDLVHFTILRPTEKSSSTPNSELALIPFPQDELFIEKLSEFDLLIFDRYTYRAVLSPFHFDNIARYVDEGGAMLVAAGPEYNGPQSLASRRNLSFILPATPAGAAIERAFRPAVSALGERHPVTAELPEAGFWGRWLRIMPVVQREGAALLSDPQGAPLLILHRVGAGRVGLLLSDHVWLWARGFDGGGPHAELLRRVAHWLMKEPELEEEALSLSDEGGALVIRRRTIGEAPPAVSLTAPNGETAEHELAEVSAGLYEKRLENAPRGLYRARSGELFAVGAVGLEAAAEFQDVVSHSNKLTPLAEATGGGVFSARKGERDAPPALRRVSPNASARAGDGWAGLVERDATRIEAVRERPLLPAWGWLAFIGAALALAWLIESGRLRRRA